MRLNRIYCDGPLAEHAEMALPSAGAYHVARVLRMRAGATLNIFDGSGLECHAEIIRIDGDKVTVRVGAPSAGAAESPLRITLVQGISRSERMDWTLQKATELGVTAIAPVLT
jgi:16S rRNA (uracil1498-N3)-methyltransferase